jgi:hypothetical protein
MLIQSKSVSTDHQAIINPSGCISSCSAGFASLFGLSKELILEGRFPIESAIPNFQANLVHLMSAQYVFAESAHTKHE